MQSCAGGKYLEGANGSANSQVSQQFLKEDQGHWSANYCVSTHIITHTETHTDHAANMPRLIYR